MVVQIPLSLSGPADVFAATLEAHRAALAAHRIGKPGYAAPRAVELVDSLVARVPASGPVATRGPDTFQIVPYEIVDDTPPPPTLEQTKAVLLNALHAAANMARDAILSPARAKLLALQVGDALAIPETSRSPAQVAAIEAYMAFQSRCVEIDRNVTVAHVEIEDLDAAGVNTWKVPAL